MTTLTTADGVRLDAHHEPGPTGLGIVVAHGLTGGRRRPATRRVVAGLRPTGGVVSFDFRGHGRSGGLCTVGDREIHDLAAVVDWTRRLGYRRVVTVGFSMGAAVALRHAARDRGLGAVVSVSGPAHWFYRDTAAMRRVFWAIETRAGRLAAQVTRGTRIATDGWTSPPEPPVVAVAAVAPTPLLIVHGDRDPFFPVGHAQALHAAAGQPSELWLEPGLGHAETAVSASLLARIGDWLRATAVAGERDTAAAAGPDELSARIRS